MIVKISSSGTSFKGLAQYLTHDPQAETSQRVTWTHTHNLANDDVPCAVNEMYLTAGNAELLKQEAGIRAGGRKTENPVKHISLNWKPTDNPSQKHMIETSSTFLKAWAGVIIRHIRGAHDKSIKTSISSLITHPETGRHLKRVDGTKARLGLGGEYERAQGYIRCPQRWGAWDARNHACTICGSPSSKMKNHFCTARLLRQIQKKNSFRSTIFKIPNGKFLRTFNT